MNGHQSRSAIAFAPPILQERQGIGVQLEQAAEPLPNSLVGPGLVPLIPDDGELLDPESAGEVFDLKGQPHPLVPEPLAEADRGYQEIVGIPPAFGKGPLEAFGQIWENTSQDPGPEDPGLLPLQLGDGALADAGLAAELFDGEAGLAAQVAKPDA